ncbi:MAG: hypothetical protein KU37_04365 [Sulfuricurvum sp. PC08-66]|nr:MAG: hypothetical protein KU37_04365 [Sulfuricurvum sp. PC08-66]
MLDATQYDELMEAIENYNSNTDLSRAHEVFERLATHFNDDESQFFLGLMYENGEVVSKDIDKAIYWWKKAANNRNRDAHFRLQTYSISTNTRY